MLNNELVLSPEGAGLIKHYENCLHPTRAGYFKPYICPAGVLTIGWGHTNNHGRRFNANTIWTQAQCDAAFEEDMRGFEAAVRRLVKVELSQHQFDALVSFSYNCGDGALSGSTLLRKLNKGDHAGAAREFMKWTHGGGRELPGLVKRRASEAQLFKSVPCDRYAEHDPVKTVEEPMGQAVEAPAPPKSIVESKNAIGASTIGTATVGEAVDKVNEHLEKLNTAKEDASNIGIFDGVGAALHDPKFLLLLGVLAIVGFLIWDRHHKLTTEQV